MFTVFQLISMILVFATISSVINHFFLKIPQAIGVPVVASVLSLIFILFNHFYGTDSIFQVIVPEVKSFEFDNFLLHGILAFLLFAGATKVDISALRKWKGPIFSLAFFGVIITAFSVATLIWGFTKLPFVGIDLPFLYALLFGALIAPTDPIAAHAILKKVGAPKNLETKLVGESLFNDGTGVVMFLTVLGIIAGENPTVSSISINLLTEIIGACILGFILGYILYRLLKRIKDHSIVLLSTLAIASFSYTLAEMWHFSAPIATVVCGLVIGNKTRNKLDEETIKDMDKFWDFIDEMLNACLFALMGLELLVLDLDFVFMIFGVVAFVCTILARFIGVYVPLLVYRKNILKGTIPVLTWGGLRGGISLALALSLPPSEYSQLLATVAFTVVMLSLIIQGLTLEKVIKYTTK